MPWAGLLRGRFARLPLRIWTKRCRKDGAEVDNSRSYPVTGSEVGTNLCGHLGDITPPLPLHNLGSISISLRFIFGSLSDRVFYLWDRDIIESVQSYTGNGYRYVYTPVKSPLDPG